MTNHKLFYHTKKEKRKKGKVQFLLHCWQSLWQTLLTKMTVPWLATRKPYGACDMSSPVSSPYNIHQPGNIMSQCY
jgi:hypothetical protein